MASSAAPATKKKRADLKVVIMGDSSVGKSTLIQRYLTGKFEETISHTIGASFFLKQWGPYNIAIWDTAGEEKFAGLSSFYCRNASAAILAYDISEKESFDSLGDRHVPLLQAAEQDCLAVVVGTKLDLVRPKTRKVNNEDGEHFAVNANKSRFEDGAKNDIRIPFFETSSITGENVNNVFTYIFETLLPLDHEGNPIDPNAGRKRPEGVVHLESHIDHQRVEKNSDSSAVTTEQKKKSGCC